MHGNALDNTGIVDQNVNLAYLLMDFVDQVFDGIFVGDITDIALDVLDACLLVVVQTALKGSLVNVVKDNGLGTSSYESLGDVETNTVGSAGNPGVLSF